VKRHDIAVLRLVGGSVDDTDGIIFHTELLLFLGKLPSRFLYNAGYLGRWSYDAVYAKGKTYDWLKKNGLHSPRGVRERRRLAYENEMKRRQSTPRRG
jgi:hypothetical protein